MDIRQLRYAIALAEHRHFGRAAAAVGIAQPPLSKAIAGLEAEVGAVLFERDRRGVYPTAAGEALLVRARRIVAELGAAVDDAQRAARGETGHVRLGFISSALLSTLPPVLREFRHRHPDVRLDVEEMSSSDGSRAVVAGRVDAVICRGAPRGRGVEDLAVVPVSRDHLTAVVGTAHPFAGQPHITVEQLRGQPLVVARPDAESAVFRDLVEVVPGVDESELITTRDLQTIIGLAACGIGIGLGPQDMRVMGRTDVSMVDVRPPVPLPGLYLAFDPDRRSDALSALLDVVSGICPVARPALARVAGA